MIVFTCRILVFSGRLSVVRVEAADSTFRNIGMAPAWADEPAQFATPNSPGRKRPCNLRRQIRPGERAPAICDAKFARADAPLQFATPNSHGRTHPRHLATETLPKFSEKFNQ